MWEPPNREGTGSGNAADRGGDALGGPPDAGRPANPWPRLIAFAATVLVCAFLAGLCVVSFANPPKRELKIAIEELAVGVPRFFPVTTFGADPDGNTYGAWVTLISGPPNDPTPRPAALLSKAPDAKCHVRWVPTAQAGGRTGVFVDPCGTARYSELGGTVEGTPLRNLDAFPARVDRKSVVVDVTQVTLGACRAAGATACSRPGQPEVRKVPNDALPVDFGRR